MKEAKPWNLTRYNQKGNRYEFEFAGTTVGSIMFGGGVTIYLNDEFSTQIDLWMPFLIEQHGQSQTCNPRGKATQLAPLLDLVERSVAQAVAEKSGFLTLNFDNQTKIQAPFDSSEQRFEAWQIRDKHGFHVVCAFGGNLAIWLPNAEVSRRRSKMSSSDAE